MSQVGVFEIYYAFLMEVKENKFSTDIRKHFFILQVINVWNGLLGRVCEVKDAGVIQQLNVSL